MRFATLIVAAAAQQFTMDEVAEMIAVTDVDTVEEDAMQFWRKTDSMGGKWDPNGLKKFEFSDQSAIKSIKFCRAPQGWLKSETFLFGNGRKFTAGDESGASDCETIKLEAGDCIKSVTTYAGGYVEEWTFNTAHGSYGHVGNFMNKGSAPKKFDFGGACLKGVYGRTNGHIVEQGFIF